MNYSGEATKRVKMPICEKYLTEEISTDYTLPDYQPEIRRIIDIKAQALPPAKYVSGSAVEFNGNIDYQILYVGADGELYSLPLSAEYALSAPLNQDLSFDFNEGIVAFADLSLESPTTRLSSPRKLTVKCKLAANARAYAVMMLDEKLIGDCEPTSIERLRADCIACDFLHSTSDIFEISTEIIPDSTDTRVISASANVFVTDTVSGENSCKVRGDIYLNILTGAGEGPGNTKIISRKLPFNTDVEVDSIRCDSKCMARGFLSDLAVNIEEDKIICDAKILFDIFGQNNIPFSYTKDLYSTERYSEPSFRDLKIPGSGYCLNGNFSMNDRMIKENIGFPEGATIIDVTGTAISENTEQQNSKNIVNGQVKYTILLYNNGEYSNLEVVLPLKYEFDSDNTLCSTKNTNITVISCHAREDSESLSIDAELCVSAWGMSENEIVVVDEVKFGDIVSKNKGDIIIYYLTPDDTTWSVAKKYHIPKYMVESSANTEISDYVII